MDWLAEPEPEPEPVAAQGEEPGETLIPRIWMLGGDLKWANKR